ncbi:hypothetical protein FRUB_03964 [Fimbriiglobus ruber]|uniref:Uncharacterized protein n=1 Tax=Fimbriiglobus ruber TaxID=1908690 RepID=A0A225DW70_9BACT|nr:hypothetical protein FRUB_03964 [Fimbriiglobus ruber]
MGKGAGGAGAGVSTGAGAGTTAGAGAELGCASGATTGRQSGSSARSASPAARQTRTAVTPTHFIPTYLRAEPGDGLNPIRHFRP